MFSASNKYLPRLLSFLILRTDSNCTNLKIGGWTVHILKFI